MNGERKTAGILLDCSVQVVYDLVYVELLSFVLLSVVIELSIGLQRSER